MRISTYKSETIVINDPSEKLIGLMNRMREHKQERRNQMRNTQPTFTLTV